MSARFRGGYYPIQRVMWLGLSILDFCLRIDSAYCIRYRRQCYSYFNPHSHLSLRESGITQAMVSAVAFPSPFSQVRKEVSYYGNSH